VAFNGKTRHLLAGKVSVPRPAASVVALGLHVVVLAGASAAALSGRARVRAGDLLYRQVVDRRFHHRGLLP